MNTTILQRYNVDKDAFSAFLQSPPRSYTLINTGADGNERWNAPDDSAGDTTLTIKQAGKDYNVHVWSAKAAPLEQGADYSFSDARMKFEGIDAAELTRRLVNEGYSDDKPKGKQTSSFAVRKTQTNAKPKPKYQFPSSLKLDEDSLLLPNGGELKQDPLVLDVYRGRIVGNMRENIAFIYRDSDGTPESLIYRIKNKDGGKSIRQYAFNAESGTFTVGGVDNKNRRLFLEESARELSTIIFCEGEKCVYDLQRFFLEQGINDVGATTAGGSNNINPDIIGAVLGGKNVYIIPDADPPGNACAEKVRRALLGTGSAVQVWKWNDDTPESYDISNLLEEQGDKLAAGSSDLDSFFRSLDGLDVGSWTDGAFLSDYEKEESGEEVDDEDVEETLAELYEENPPMPPFLIPDLIRENDTVILTAQGGAGKSWFSISLAYAVATGTKFLDRFDALGVEKNVYYINPEMIRADVNVRFQTFTKERLDNIWFLHWDKVKDKMKQHPSINLADKFWLKFIERKIQKLKIDLLVIDSFLLCYRSDVSSNAAEFAQQFNQLILMCRDNNCTLLAVVHDGKDFTKEGRGTSAILDMPNLSLKISKPEKPISNRKECEFNLSFGQKNRSGVPEIPFYARRDRNTNRWVTKSADDIREAAREEQDKQENYALELFRDGKTPGELKSTEYAGLVPKKELKKLYDDFMPSFLSEQYNDGEPLKDLLDRYEKPLVRRTIISMYPHNYGAACAILYEAGDDKNSILQTYRAIKGQGAPEPPELTKAEAERTAKKNEERKAEYFKQLDEGLRIDELRKKFEMQVNQHNAYFAEWSGDRARELIQEGVGVRDILQARLPDNRNKFDLVAVATTYIEMKDDKRAAIEELSAIEGIDRKKLQKVAKGFDLSLPSKPVGRPRKEKAKSDATTSAESIQKI